MADRSSPLLHLPMETLEPILLHSLPSPSSSTPEAISQMSEWRHSLPVPWYQMVASRPRINRHIPERAILQQLVAVTDDLKWLTAVQNVLKIHLRNLEMEYNRESNRVCDIQRYMKGYGSDASGARAKAYLQTMWPAEVELKAGGIAISWIYARRLCVERYLRYVETAERVVLAQQVEW